MKKSVGVFILCSLAIAFCQSGIPLFHAKNHFLLTSPGAMGVGLYGNDNPAMLTYLHAFDLAFMWSGEKFDWNDLDRWGVFTGVPNFGFSVNREEESYGALTSYDLSLALGNKRQSIGIGYEWCDYDTALSGRPAIWKLGYLARPVRYISMGLTGSFASSGGGREGYGDLAIRPFGNEKLAIFADYAIQRGQEFQDASWSAGVAIEALPGIRLTGRYFNNRSFTAGLNFSLGRIGTITQLHFDAQQDHSFTTYGARLGAYDRNIIRPTLERKKKYVEMDLLGPVKYQRYALFDKGQTLANLLKAVDIAKKDATVSGIAINTSGMQIDHEMAWELREKLKDFRSAGKHLVVYIDEVEFIVYYLASVADRIVLDPEGTILLTGTLFGRMYLKGTLDKLGIGIDEWRFFKYKSAAEALSRESMSEADREQWQALVDDFYATAKADICTSRNFAPEEFDELIDRDFVFIPAEALENDLVDTLGRWEAVEEIVGSLEGRKRSFVQAQALDYYQLPKDNYWGERPKIAIVYALGECAMDTGIKARQLVKDIESVTANKEIKAVVFRVDSPGGSALASDIVAEALRKCQKKKPVIVTQGLVAGSGGYWLSMYGDTIVAAPYTITGSIGVIGFWLYNKELKEKIGVNTDMVKVGEHADLGFGFNFPFLGTLPDRNLTEEERARMETLIKTMYREFVGKVAEGRSMKREDVEEVAQGRVWSGTGGAEKGLVDVLGGLETAILIAKEKAGIPKDAEVTIVELPRLGFIPSDLFQPKLLGITTDDLEFKKYLNFCAEHNGELLPMLPLEDIMSINKMRKTK